MGKGWTGVSDMTMPYDEITVDLEGCGKRASVAFVGHSQLSQKGDINGAQADEYGRGLWTMMLVSAQIAGQTLDKMRELCGERIDALGCGGCPLNTDENGNDCMFLCGIDWLECVTIENALEDGEKDAV